MMVAERLMRPEGGLPLRSTLISDSKTAQSPIAGVRDGEVGLGLKADPSADLVPSVRHLRQPCGFCSTDFQRRFLKNPNLLFNLRGTSY